MAKAAASKSTREQTRVGAKRALRIERPAGSAIIVEALADAGIDAFFERVQAWFAARGDATLFDDAFMLKDLRRDHAALVAALKDDASLAAPASVVARLDVGNLGVNRLSTPSNLPAPIQGSHYPTHPGLERRAITTYVIATDNERFPTETGLAVRHVEGGAIAEVELRPRGHLFDTAALSEVSAMASSMTPVDDDILDILLSNATLNKKDTDGLFTIEIDAILSARNSGVKKKVEDGKEYYAGYRQRSRDDVIERVRNLESLYILHSERRMRGKPVRLYEKVVSVKRLVIDPTSVDERVMAIQYELSAKLTQWIDGVLVTPRKLLELDGRNGAPAKALGRYLFQRAALVDEDGYFRCIVGELLKDLRRTQLDSSGRHSGRPRQHLERDLAELSDNDIVADWSYVETGTRSADAAFDRGYRVAEAWLGLHLQIKLQAAQPADALSTVLCEPLAMQDGANFS